MVDFPRWFAPLGAKTIQRQMQVFLIWLFLVLINQTYEHKVTRDMLLSTKEILELRYEPKMIESMSISDVAFLLETNTVQFLNTYTIPEIKRLDEEQRNRIRDTNNW